MKAFLQRAVLATVMLLASIMARAYDFEVDGIYYNKTSETKVEVTKGDKDYTGKVTIPGSVTSSGQNYSVTAIGMNAFSACESLSSVELPNSIVTIGGFAFNHCTSLSNIVLPNSVTSIEPMAFRGSGLTSIELSNSLTSIGNEAFVGCSSLSTVKIPASVNELGIRAFGDCSALTSIDVDEDNKNYSSIDGVLFDKGQNGLLCCPGGKKGTYSIPNSVIVIEDSAFDGCTGLTFIEIPNSVTALGQGVFSGCTSLTTIEIPASVTVFNIWGSPASTFAGCSGTTAINIDPDNEVYSSIDGVVFNKDQTLLICYPGGKSGSYIVPNSAKEIGESAFYKCNGLTSIEMPNSVTSIDEYAFESCENLTSVQIPESIVSIGSSSFSGCNNICEVIVLKSEPPVISVFCFESNIYSSSTLYVHRKDIEAYKAADVWKKWEKIEAIPYDFEEDGAYYNFISDTEVEVTYKNLEGGGYTGDIIIPSSITYMSKTYAVSSIGENAFANCKGITSVEIPASVRSIGKNAFANCTALKIVKVAYAEEGPAKVIAENEEANVGTAIGESAFQGCSVLSNIYLGSTVASIGNTAFAACPEIESITVLATEPPTAQSDAFDSAIYSTSALNVPVVAYDLYKTAPVWSNWATINSIGGSGIADSFVETTVKIETANGEITVSGAEGGVCRIFDLRGMEVASRSALSAGESFTVKTSELYIVQLTTKDGKNVTRKVMVK